jgi:hypothetical protein
LSEVGVRSNFNSIESSDKPILSETHHLFCGHEGREGVCSVLCDDFVSTAEGYCYLLGFEVSTRPGHLSALGLNPMVGEFMPRYNMPGSGACTVHVNQSFLRPGMLHFMIDGPASPTTSTVKISECHSCGRVSIYRSCSLQPVSIEDCFLCGRHRTRRSVSAIRFTLQACRIGSRLPVSNIIKSESTAIQFEMNEPSMYTSEAPLPQFESFAELYGNQIRVSIGEDSLVADGYSDTLKTFVHDFVASRWSTSTDSQLSLLGVEGPEGSMTPDFIIEGTRCVLELGTCNSDNEKAIKSMYNDKTVKYMGELKQVKAKFFIIIVSPLHVYTNANISQNFVDELTIRMRQATPMKERITELLGEDIFNDEYSETERMVKSLFAEIPAPEQINSKYFYNLQEMKYIKSPMTNDDSLNSAKILLNTFMDTENIHKASKLDLDKYMMKFTPANSRNDSKRISNLPILLPGPNPGIMDTCFEGGEESLKTVWSQINQNRTEDPDPISIDDILNNKEPVERHFHKKSQMKKVTLSREQSLELAIHGIGGKKHADDPDVEKHQFESKKSFHPLTDVKDIEEFCKIDLLHIEENSVNPFLDKDLVRMVKGSKALCCPKSESKSIELWEMLLKTDFMKYSMMMSEVFIELSYCYKHWTSTGEFLHKTLDCGIEMIIYNPKSSVFVSFAVPCNGAVLWDRGRLGPPMFKSSTHYFTEWSSFDNSQLEHYVKFGPYMGSCLIDLMNSSDSKFFEISKYARECSNHLLMLYLNNKTDVEELITSQRYLFMKLLEDVGTSPYIFVDRFPKVLRSRLTSFYLQRTIDLMEYYSTNKISKIPQQGQEMILYNYINIKSLFSSSHISLSMKVNEFYMGYVVSKERNTGKDKTFKVLTKLLSKEQKFRENVRGSIFTRGTEVQEFKTNIHLLKFFSKSFADKIQSKFGENYKKKILGDFVREAARTSFGELATLKVSARDHGKEVEIKLGGENTEKIYEMAAKLYPEEVLKRPYCMESITSIINEFETETGHSIRHVTQLAPWCLSKLLSKGYFDSDEFDKSQHGGEREIHVLEIKARIVQFYLETLSRVICSYFPSETTVTPMTKETFVKDHYAKAKTALGSEFTTVSKSADATTWCQYHHVSHFAGMLMNLLPDELLNFAISGLSLWPRKRISFPMKQASSLAANQNLISDNEVFMKFKEEFNEGKGMFTSPRSNCIEVISGMFQGILHSMSSLYHTMIQEVMKEATLTLATSRLGFREIHVTVCQGSDDSAKMISVKGKPSSKIFKRMKRLLLWKERVSPYLSVHCNEAKSSIGTHDLVEYNSEWHVRHQLIKPTFRLVSASQTLSVTERFIDRYRIYSNILTDCLSGGASSLECSVIQLFQCTQHYIMMGLTNKKSKPVVSKYIDMLLANPNPMHGFFPLDEDVACAVPGVEYLLYNLYNTTSFGCDLRNVGDSDVDVDFSPEDIPDWMKSKDLSSVRLKFSNMRLFYKVLERMNIEPLASAIEAVEQDPEILFSKNNSWTDEQHNLVLKVYSRGVKESISNRSSSLRMTAASSYILTNRCFSSSIDTSEIVQLDKESLREVETLKKILTGDKEVDKETLRKIKEIEKTNSKVTLLSLMEKYRDRANSSVKDIRLKNVLFPYHKEYDRLNADITNLSVNSVLIDQYTKRTSKAKLAVIEKPVGEVDVIAMCKRQWFRGKVPFSRSQFARKWQELIAKFSFLSSTPGIDGFKETCMNLKMNSVQAKMFLESLSLRARSVVLYDSHSRTGNITYSLSRIYWPHKKLMLPESATSDKLSELRSSLFSILTFWFSSKKKTDLVRDTLRYSSVLSQPWNSLPPQGIRLRLMSEVLKGTENSLLIDRIEATKRGLLGTFTQVQKGFGNSRKGLGVWQGSICGIKTAIHMQDNTCLKIIVSSLHDTVSLGMHLNGFLNDSNLDIPDQDFLKLHHLPKTNSWLNRDGKILIGQKYQGVPIYQNENLTSIYLDQTINMSWYVDINNQNIRIRARNQDTNNVYTILSETMTSSDWIPGLVPSNDDPVFKQWQMGESANLLTLETMLKEIFPKNIEEFMKTKGAIDKNRYMNRLEWDLKVMKEVIRDNFRINFKIRAAVDRDDDVMLDADVLSRFQKLIEQELESFGEDIDFEMWGDEVEYEEQVQDEMWGINTNNEEDQELDAAINLFKDSTGVDYYELIDLADTKKNYRMPSSNRFFSSVDHLNTIMNKESFRTSITLERRSEGLLGMLLSIVNDRYSMGRDEGLSSEIIEIEEELKSISSTISRPEALMKLTLEELRVNIANLQDTIESSSGTLKARYIRLLNTYLDREEEVMTRLDPHSKDAVVLNSSYVIEQLQKEFPRLQKLPIDLTVFDKEMSKNIFLTFIKTEVSRSKLVSDGEKEESLLHLSTNSINRSTLQTIGTVFGINLFINSTSVSSSDDPTKRIDITLAE